MINNPEYFLHEELGVLVSQIKSDLNFSVLNYQYGYVSSLESKLVLWEKSPQKSMLKFPLVWLEEPITINRNKEGIYGETSPGTNIFIITGTKQDLSEEERWTEKFHPILFPVYRALLNAIVKSQVFDHIKVSDIPHSYTVGYYYDSQKSVLTDKVDCLKISELRLRIHDKNNNSSFSNM